MVTFSLPGENDAAPATNGTPRARPPLPFAKRAYGAASPFGNGPSKRLGTPHSAPSRKFLTTRDEPSSSSLNKSNIATARNIFRASAISDSPPASVPFSPNLPQSTMKKVFAPGATPEPSRVHRESTAYATPRGMAAKTTDKELFPMRISSPPPELSGEALAQKVPKEWNSKGSIYADQFLSHLCPPDLDEEQRRQFFCILDLRRLKYAANEIFARKDWKLNVINFAKEFEKSRSIILLRYGLYEFQNVKPSKEVLKRWRREHGLPEPEDEEQEEVEAPAPTPSKSAPSKKRKADDGLTKDSAESREPLPSEKRQTRSKVGQEDPAPISTPEPAGKNKRKASAGESDQPSKRSTPSATKALFEKIANKPATPAEPSAPAAPKPNLFAANKSSNNNLARSVFTNIKSGAGQAQPAAPAPNNVNIFGYLSDASSAKNSGVEGDADSETDSEEDDSQEAEETEEPSGDASAAEAEDSAVATGTGVSTRESTPGRSIFDRVTKGNDGQPVRAPDEETPAAEKPAAPADQTWNPSTTPLKFAPASTSSSVFGKSDASAGSAGSIFAPKSTAPSNLFGAAKQDAPSEKKAPAAETDKDGGESDKENDSQPAKKPMFEAKSSTPAGQQPFGSLFQQKPTNATSETPSESSKPAANLFGGASKTAAPAASNLFGPATSKPDESTPVMQSSTLFGGKTSEPAKTTSEEPSAPNSGVSTPATGEQPATTAPSFFGAKPASTAAPSTNLFGAGSTASTAAPAAAPTTSLFGASSAPKSDAPASGSSTPVFSFGGNTTGTSTAAPAQKPLFGAPKSPPASNNTSNMFGSPMKQDDQSPAKKQFTGGNAAGSAAPTFSFGGASSAPSTNIFGGATNNATTNGNNTSASFGSDNSANAGSGGFGFNFSAGGDKSATTSFNNPFTSGGAGGAGGSGSAAPSTGGMFNFGGSSAPSSGASTPFQFGGASGNTAAPSGAPAFGGNQAANNPTPMFGGASTGGSSAFNFTAAPTSQPQASGSIFGASQAAPAFLAPPAGGSSTTGTNSPLNLGGGSSLATTPAAGTPEPTTQNEGNKEGNEEEEGEKHEQISLTEGAEADEELVHEVRAKVLKFVPPSEQSDSEEKSDKAKSPWSTKGVGPLRLLKHKETNAVRLLLRAEPRGHVALNRGLLPDLNYEPTKKYVKLTTSNEKGDGLETWMIQVKTEDLAKKLATVLEENKVHNKK